MKEGVWQETRVLWIRRKAVDFFKEKGYLYMERKESELLVITRAKDLCSYVMIVTQKSPKHFRYTFVSRLQNLTLSVIENLFRANDIYVRKGDNSGIERRLELQRQAMTDLKVLAYFSMLAMEQQCILPKQYELIARQVTDCQGLLGAWMNSVKKLAR